MATNTFCRNTSVAKLLRNLNNMHLKNHNNFHLTRNPLTDRKRGVSFTSSAKALNLNSISSSSIPTDEGSNYDKRTTKIFTDTLPEKGDDPDTFGTLGKNPSVKDNAQHNASLQLHNLAREVESIFTEEEADDMVFKPEVPWSMPRLTKIIFKLLEQNKLREALDTFMEAVQDGGFPFHKGTLTYIASALISACAQTGHVQMAFKLFDMMKKRGALKESWYTSLLNACGNSPWDSEENLQRIHKVREHMSLKGIQPNHTHYHAMVKAYGRCGSIESAFAVVDEMVESSGKKALTPETFNFLLQACITDRSNGFKHAVLTWEKMNQCKIKPDLYTYNLFLRAIRECGIKLPPSTKSLHKSIESNNEIPTKGRHFPEILNPAEGKLKENLRFFNLILLDESDSLRSTNQDQFPLIKKDNYEIRKLLQLPENRLAILGGLRAITTQLLIHKVAPTIKTVTELVQIVSPKEIPDVLALLEVNHIKPDIHFLNMMMKKYISWNQIENARNVITLFANYQLSPNIVTWGVLAVGSKTWSESAKLLREMDSMGFVPNEEILGALVKNASQAFNPRFIIRILEEHVRRELRPDSRFVSTVRKFIDDAHKANLDVELDKEVHPRKLKPILETEEFQEYLMKLELRLESWIEQVGIQEKEIPWKGDFEERMDRLRMRRYEPK